MKTLQTPFRYDYVGSFLRPQKLKEARRAFDTGRISHDDLKKVEDEAITELTVIVWFADKLSFVKLNLVIVLIAIHLIFIFARMVRSVYA